MKALMMTLTMVLSMNAMAATAAVEDICETGLSSEGQGFGPNDPAGAAAAFGHDALEKGCLLRAAMKATKQQEISIVALDLEKREVRFVIYDFSRQNSSQRLDNLGPVTKKTCVARWAQIPNADPTSLLYREAMKKPVCGPETIAR